MVEKRQQSGSSKSRAARPKRKLTAQEVALRHLVPKEIIAARYSVSPRTIELWVSKRRIPCIKVGRGLRFSIEECDRAVERFKRYALQV